MVVATLLLPAVGPFNFLNLLLVILYYLKGKSGILVIIFKPYNIYIYICISQVIFGSSTFQMLFFKLIEYWSESKGYFG